MRPGRDNPHPGTESSETHPARHHKEWRASMQTQVPPTLQQEGSGWGSVEGCMDCGSVEAGVGSIRTHPSTSARIGPRRRRQGRRPESKTLDDSKQTTNWGRSLQIIHEEVRTVRQCSLCDRRRPITSSTAAHYIDHHPKSASSKLDHWVLTRAWLQPTVLTIWYEYIRKKKKRSNSAIQIQCARVRLAN